MSVNQLSGVQGWVILENQVRTKYYPLFVSDYEVNPFFRQDITHLPNRDHFTLPLGIFWFEFVITDIFMTLDTDIEKFVKDIIAWQDEGWFYISIEKNEAGDLWKVDGVNERYKVAVKGNGWKGLKKVSNGDVQTWTNRQLIFEEAEEA